jgi:hypothetical protein
VSKDIRVSLDPKTVAELKRMLDGPMSAETARLIVAAPDLLEAAQRLVKQMDQFRTWDQGDWRAVLGVVREMYDQFCAAIAKAEGKP